MKRLMSILIISVAFSFVLFLGAFAPEIKKIINHLPEVLAGVLLIVFLVKLVYHELTKKWGGND